MAVRKIHKNLSDQIPWDVRERTRKAGVSQVDWYAGRLDVGDAQLNERTPPEQAAELKEAARRGRHRHRQRRRETLIRRLQAVRLRVRRPRGSGHARQPG